MFLKLLLAISVFASASNDGNGPPLRKPPRAPSTAVITHSPALDLYVSTFDKVELVDIERDENGGVTSAALAFDFMVEPDGCNTFFLDGEIIAQVKTENDKSEFETKDPYHNVALGSLWPVSGAFSTCVGVPPRPAKLKLSFLNFGNGQFKNDDRIYTFEFKGPRGNRSQEFGKWLVRVRANRATGQLEVLPTEFISSDPVVLEKFVQIFDCPLSDRFGKPVPNEHMTIEVTQADITTAHVEFISQANFGDTMTHTFDLATDAARSPIFLALKGRNSQNDELSVQMNERDLGWQSPDPVLSFDFQRVGGEVVLRMMSCKVVGLKPL